MYIYTICCVMLHFNRPNEQLLVAHESQLSVYSSEYTNEQNWFEYCFLNEIHTQQTGVLKSLAAVPILYIQSYEPKGS